MTGTQIKIDAQLMTGTIFIDNTVIQYLNKGIEQLVKKYPNAATLKTSEIVVEDTDKYYDIPADILKIESLTNAKIGRINSKYFVFEDDTIKIAFTGIFTMKYREYPATITDLTKELLIPRVFQDPLAHYLAYRESLKLYGANYYDTQYHLQNFWTMLQEANTNYRKKKPRIIKAYYND